MDKATGKALVIDGKEVTAVTEFTAAGTEGAHFIIYLSRRLSA